MSIIEINGVDFPAPSSIKINTSDIDNINVNELGVEQRDNVRTGIHSISLGFKELNNSDTYLIQSALEPLVLRVKLPTPRGFQTKEMRLDGPIDIDMALNKANKVCWNISFNLKEY